MLPRAGAVHRGPHSGLCVRVRAQAHILMPASFPKGKQAPNRARAGGKGALKSLTVGFPLVMIFLLMFCLLGILPVLYVCMLHIVGAVCMLHPWSVKHRSREVLLAGFVWLLGVTHESNWRHHFCER